MCGILTYNIFDIPEVAIMLTMCTNYEVMLADTPEAKTIHYNIRYQVYCLEKGYEPPEKFSNAMEMDDYDERAVHFAVKCRRTDQWMGAFRIIVDSPANLPMNKMTPLESSEALRNNDRLAEFSRLAILRPFQNLQGKDRQDLAVDEPEILQQMVLAGFQYARIQGLSSIVYLCKRSLARVLNRFGIPTVGIGSAILHRGVRYPYMSELEFLDQYDRTIYKGFEERSDRVMREAA
jgi:N-acyl amino acid synthase of PEP-CTERM/exosortase system